MLPLTQKDIEEIEKELQSNNKLNFKDLFIKKLIMKNSFKCDNIYQIKSETAIEIFKTINKL